MELSLLDSKLTLSLPQKDIYISAFESKLVIGKVESKVYVFALEFFSFELNLLYSLLRQFTEFFVNDTIKENQGPNVIKENKEYSYYWEGKCPSVEVKFVQVFIKSKNLVHSIEFDMSLLESLLNSITNIYFSTFLIGSHEKYFLFMISKQKLEDLDLMQNLFNKHFYSFFDKFVEIFPSCKRQQFEFHQLFLFYFQDLTIMSKLFLLNNTE